MLSKEQLNQIKFTNLVQHSHWTIPMGIGHVKKQIQGTTKKGLNGFAITDNNVMSGVLETYFLSKDKDFLEKSKIDKLPIAIGARLSFTDDLENKDLSRLFSLTLFAKSMTGYKNLIYLNSISSDENHFFQSNRLSISELMEKSEDLVVGSGGINGLLGQAIVKGTGQEEDLAQIFKENFGENFFIEIHFHPVRQHWDVGLKKYTTEQEDLQKTVNLRLIEIAKKLNIKCCLVQNSYMVEEKHYSLQSILIQNHPDYKKSGWTMDQSYYLMSVEEMYNYIKKNSDYISDDMFLEYCANTQDILNLCKDIKLEFVPALPAIKYEEHVVNVDKTYEDKLADLRKKMDGFCDLMTYVIDQSKTDISLRTTIKTIIRLNKIDWTNKVQVDRLGFELKVMQLNGVIRLCDYFLLLEDVTNYVRSVGKLRGFGRGSGGGSLLTYVMDISDVDPVKYGLLFERFLTKERIGTYFFDIIGYEFKNKEEEDLTNPYFEKLKALLNPKRMKEINKEYLAKELEYLEFNPNVAEYVFKTQEQIKTKGEKTGNENNSTVSYCLDITDKLPKDFIKSTPTTLPDFDYDTDGRDEVKEFLVRKYGKNHVTLMGTIGTLKTKGALKDIIRQLRPLKDSNGVILKPEVSFEEVNELTKKFNLLKPTDFKTEIEFYEASIEADSNLKKWVNDNKDIDEALRMLLGNAKSTGIHAGGIVVSSRNVLEVMPMTWSFDEKMWVTQSEMGYVERSGLIKYDFLGLKTLGDLNRVLKLVNERHGTSYNLSNIPMDEEEILELFVKGATESVFQFNTDLATSILVQLKVVRSILDLAMITSIARPGPLQMGMDKTFISRNTEREDTEFLHHTLKPILKDTYGILCYQEQIIQIAKAVGDFDNDASVSIMKALSKKQLDKVVKYKEKFIKNAQKHGYTPAKADQLWQLMESFASYGFNLSHAAAYACVSYLCMWFKMHYPAEWYSAVLSGADKDDFKVLYPKWKDYIKKPDINLSKDSFVIDAENKVVMPLNAINGVGVKAVENIIKNQPYATFADFHNKIDKRQVNKATTISLIFSGVFDSMKPADCSENKWRKMLILEFLKLKYIVKKPSKAEKEQDDQFIKDVANMNRGAMLMKEISLLNFTAFNYFEYYKDKMTDGARQKFGYEAITPGKVAEYPDSSIVVVGGSIEEITIAPVKNPKSKIFGQEMARIKLGNAGETIEVVLFPRQLQDDDKAGGMIRQLQEYTPIVIKGRVSRFGGGLSLTYEAGWILV